MSDRHQHFKIKIAVSGAAETSHCGEGTLELAELLGAEIAKQQAILVTGATTGFPLWAAKGAKEAGGISIGISPAETEKEHVEFYKLPLDFMDLIIYTGEGFSGRDILITRSSDAVILGCGRIGTIHEFTVAFEDKKPIGILEGPWPTDEIIKTIIEKSNRASDNPNIIYERDPTQLVSRLIRAVGQTKVEYYKVYKSSNDFSRTCQGEDCKEPPAAGKI